MSQNQLVRSSVNRIPRLSPPVTPPSGVFQLAPGRRITATANIVQTVAGPRVVIQGVPTQGLSQSQLHNLQQQVKAELAKGQSGERAGVGGTSKQAY